MKVFEQNVINLYGKKGEAWLDELPKLVEQATSNLGFHDLKPIPNLSYNFVLSGFKENYPIILKMGLDYESLKREAFALKCFAGFGAIKVISETSSLLLLERAVPGISLKYYFSVFHDTHSAAIQKNPGSPQSLTLLRDDDTVEIACNLIQKLHQVPIPKNHDLPHIKDWLSALDHHCCKGYSNDELFNYLQKAIKLRNQLLETAGPDVLLHGDLHHDNILQHDEEWVIDPKGVIGGAAFEAAAFIRNPTPDLLEQNNANIIIQNRIAAFAVAFGISTERMANWSFIQAVLAWVWALEDKEDTQYWEKLVTIFESL